MTLLQRRVLLALFALAALFSGQTASAQSPADEARARELAAEARSLSDAHRSAEACALYRQASALVRSPGLLNNIGRCFVQEGDLLAAMLTYESAVALAESLQPSAKRQAWLQFARQEMDGLQAQLGKLMLRLPRIAGLSANLDGRPLSPELEAVWVKPGPHQLTVSAPSRISYSAQPSPAAGERLQVQVPELAPVPQQAPVAERPRVPERAPASERTPVLEPPISSVAEPPAAPVREPQEQSARASGRSRAGPWVLVGTGSAVIVAGAVTGLMASSQEAELDRRCANGRCPSPDVDPGWQDKIDSTRTLATVTDVLWGVGLAAVGVGVTLLVLDAGEGDARSELEADCHGDGCGLRWSGSF